MIGALRRAAVCASLPLVALTGCTSDSGAEGPSPEEVLAEAKATLDETSGVRIRLSTEELPNGVSGIVSAQGVGTHPPAFEGTLKVQVSGVTADAEVVAVDDVVYAKLPFTTEFTEVDPAAFGAPDPADLMATRGGLSSLLTATENAKEGDPVRSGETVLTEFSGTVPGDAVAAIIPSASAKEAFDVRYSVSDEEVLREAVLTGPFYPGSGDVTYTIGFDDYGLQREITAP